MSTSPVDEKVVDPTTDAQVTNVTEEVKPEAPPEEPEAPKKKSASKTKTPKKTTKKTGVRFDPGKVVGSVYDTPIASILRYDNPRHEPENLYAQGYVLMGDPTIEEVDPDETDDKKFISLFHLAIDPEYCEQYVALIEEFENVDRVKTPLADQSIVELAQDIQDFGQLVPILVRQERNGYVGVDGGRRIASVLYLHAKSMVMRAEKHVDAPKKAWPANVTLTTDSGKQSDVFVRSIMANLSRKDFTPLQEGRIYHDMLQQTNPESGRKWTMKDAAAKLHVHYSTFRNREALWRPHDAVTGRGLTDSQRQKVADGEIGLTTASRKALGEQHQAKTGTPSGRNNRGLALSGMQKLFDETAEVNDVRRQAIAECMGVELSEAIKESDVRIVATEEAEAQAQESE